MRRTRAVASNPVIIIVPLDANSDTADFARVFFACVVLPVMKRNDDKLDALLKQWRNIEPRGNFEANVWRRIRTSRAEQPGRVTLIELIGGLLWQRAWSVAAALIIAITAGIWGGIASVSRGQDTAKAELQFLAPGTLAGSYLQMTGKETQ